MNKSRKRRRGEKVSIQQGINVQKNDYGSSNAPLLIQHFLGGKGAYLLFVYRRVGCGVCVYVFP